MEQSSIFCFEMGHEAPLFYQPGPELVTLTVQKHTPWCRRECLLSQHPALPTNDSEQKRTTPTAQKHLHRLCGRNKPPPLPRAGTADTTCLTNVAPMACGPRSLGPWHPLPLLPKCLCTKSLLSKRMCVFVSLRRKHLFYFNNLLPMKNLTRFVNRESECSFRALRNEK